MGRVYGPWVRVPPPAEMAPPVNPPRRSPAATALAAASCVFGLAPGVARAFDPFSDAEVPPHFVLRDGAGPDALALALKGELAVRFHDLEGEGGPGHDSNTDTRTIGTRSPFVELSGFTLAPRLTLTPGFNVNTQLRFTPDDARVAATWLDGRFVTGPVDHHVEVGYRPPFATRDPHAIREPLAATVWWSAPEMHATWAVGQRFGPGDALGYTAGLSVAMGRPLGFAPVQASHAQRGTINVLAYDEGRVYSGNAPMYGARARFTAWDAALEVFGFTGELAAEAGTDELRASLAGYPSRPGSATDRTSRWYGARLSYDAFGVHALVEGVAGADGVLRRSAADAEVSYRLRLHDGRWFAALVPFVRYDLYRIADSTDVHAGQSLRSPSLSQAATWDFTVLTAGLGTPVFRELLELRVEYDHITEDNAVPTLDIPGAAFRNDELRAELRLRF